MMFSSKTTPDDLDNFIDDFQKWKMSVRKLQQNRTKLTEELDHEKRQKRKSQENEEAITFELLQVKSVISSLHQTLNNLQKVEEENKNLKLKVEKIGEDNEKTLKLHKNEVTALQANIQEVTLHYMQELSKMQQEAQEIGTQLTTQYEEKLCKKNEEIDKLCKDIETAREQQDQEKLNLQLEYQLKLSRMEKVVQSAQKPQASSAQEIFRQKLQHIQNQHANELAALHQQISKLKHDQSRTTSYPLPLSKRLQKSNLDQQVFPEKPSSRSYEEDLDTVDTALNQTKPTKPVKPIFRKRKLFLIENSYLDTED